MYRRRVFYQEIFRLRCPGRWRLRKLLLPRNFRRAATIRFNPSLGTRITRARYEGFKLAMEAVALQFGIVAGPGSKIAGLFNCCL